MSPRALWMFLLPLVFSGCNSMWSIEEADPLALQQATGLSDSDWLEIMALVFDGRRREDYIVIEVRRNPTGSDTVVVDIVSRSSSFSSGPSITVQLLNGQWRKIHETSRIQMLSSYRHPDAEEYLGKNRAFVSTVGTRSLLDPQ